MASQEIFNCPMGNNYFNYSDERIDELLEYKYLLNGWTCMVIIVIGMVANLIAVFALLHQNMRKSSTNVYLLALSFSNLMSLACMLLTSSLRFLLVHPYRAVYCIHWYESWINLLLPYLAPLNQFFQLSGIYLTMAVSIDRFILVRTRLTLGNKLRRKKITCFTIFLIYLFCFSFTLPNWFVYESKRIEIPGLSSASSAHQRNVTFISTGYSKFGQSKFISSLLNVYLYIPFVFAVPIVILFIVNTLIIYELVKIRARKRQLGSVGRGERTSITVMLIMIVIVFLVCQVPLAVSHIILAYYPLVTYNMAYVIYNSFTHILTCIDLSINFVLFCYFAVTFRETIRYMFCLRNSLPVDSRAASFYFSEVNKRNSIIQSLMTSVLSSRRGSSIDVNRKAHRQAISKRRQSEPFILTPVTSPRAARSKSTDKQPGSGNDDHGEEMQNFKMEPIVNPMRVKVKFSHSIE
nr:G protein-coupled receptor [Proales similis]